VTNKVNPELAAALLPSPTACQRLRKDIRESLQANPKIAQSLKADWKSHPAGRES